eukprot:gene11865-7551_t
MTLPTATPAATQTTTITLPTSTETQTSTVTLPTATETSSQTATLTLPAHDNFTMFLEPASFVSGQEIRIQLKATLDGGWLKAGGDGKELFNTSATGTLKVRVYKWTASTAGDCESY